MTNRVVLAASLLACLSLPSTAFGHPPISGDKKNAAKHCKEMRAASPQAFADYWGTNKNNRNAYGKCVSAQAKEEHAERHAAKRSASRACHVERKANPAAFRAKYGTNKNKRNAMGKCVSKQAKQRKAAMDAADSQQNAKFKNAAKECDAERTANPAAFQDKWGSNDNGRNAFGKCVSAGARS